MLMPHVSAHICGSIIRRGALHSAKDLPEGREAVTYISNQFYFYTKLYSYLILWLKFRNVYFIFVSITEKFLSQKAEK